MGMLQVTLAPSQLADEKEPKLLVCVPMPAMYCDAFMVLYITMCGFLSILLCEKAGCQANHTPCCL